MYLMEYNNPSAILVFSPVETFTRFQAFLRSVNTTLGLVWIKKTSVYRRKMSLHANKKGTSYEVPLKMVDRTGLEPVTSCV